MSSEGDTKAEPAGSVEGDVMTAPTPEPFDLPPDLLHPDGLTRVDVEALREAMMFAFESGVSGGMFTDALERATLGPSTWDPPSFSKDLFVDDFVARCFRVRTRGGELSMSRSHLVRVLSSPPTEARVVEHRRAIARELGDRPELRRELEQLFTSLVRFRSTLEGATLGKRYDPNRRQLELLALAKEVFDRAANGFSTATSGLSRLHRWGMRVLSGEPYRSLCDLLQYDEELATLSLEVRVGADGSIRRFQIKRVRENEDNPFVMSPIRRWLARVELFFRGYGVSSGEVMARLLGAVFEGLQDELVWFAQLAAECEVYLGALGFRDSVRAMGLEACLPELVSPEAPRVLEGLFNPLLAAHGVRPVPCDLASDRHDTTLLVTGPNSGGKTRLLQSVGITQLLAQSGLFVPCRTARLALVPGLVVSLIQETKADQAEGRLGMELIRIRDLFERLPPGAMVILDELCSGTNPSEGEEIFELVVTLLTELRPQAFVTTHFLTFAERLERGGRVDALRTLQVELGAGERPTYQFVPGVAKTSLAHRAAERLGVTRDELKSLVERNTARAKPSVSAGAKSAQASAKLAAASPARAPEKVS